MKYVLYHANCYDGFGAAYAAWKKFGDNAKYIPVSYGQEFPRKEIDDANFGTDIYILDFSYPKDEMLYWADFYKLIVLDHHKTAADNFKNLSHPNIEAYFDMDKSGARLAWEYFHCQKKLGMIEVSENINKCYLTPDGCMIPKLILSIEDRDLWKFELDGSKEIHKTLVSYPMDFELWDKFNIEDLKLEGVALERMHNQLVDNILKGSWVGMIGEYIVPMVNTSIAWSEVGESLLKEYPNYLFVASFTEFENEVMWSLRCREGYDCSVVAKQFGGGGHKQAAGFKMKKNK